MTIETIAGLVFKRANWRLTNVIWCALFHRRFVTSNPTDKTRGVQCGVCRNRYWWHK